MRSKGTLKLANGNVYTGTFENDKKSGIGKFIWSNGICYHGEYKDNKKNGKGVLTLNNGEKFQGNFYNNSKHKIGFFFNKDGFFYKQLWKYGNLEKEKKINFLEIPPQDFYPTTLLTPEMVHISCEL